MIDVVFISDLHLHPEDKDIKSRFDAFIIWAKSSVKNIYILGDFFHAWAGDDSIDEWSMGIAKQLHSLTAAGISLFYMHGNRDFLLGDVFAHHAGWKILAEPAFITLGKEKVMLAHGDRYCTKDKGHQRFRLLTRNKLFSLLFLSLPLKYRERLVGKVRVISQSNHTKTVEEMDVVEEAIIKHLSQYKITTLIHGHTHKPGLILYSNYSPEFRRYVLSDWDDNPQLLCYDNTKGIYFAQHRFEELSNG
ncbi:UDP-2,3-diacylglucosamine diphosphatase [Legionella maioricensis]|uniref:UDP-2,3-diacylglucosamine hydrolase n=1 Tax=Legionella maioricensis TaxID=2896528 RepID=A0A9X2D1Y5_9GAMM|nr:UDP-2,3-diacylglucosamine diphosphatase [Legionella maioricensis]MCL9685029.1 UDP-2,3-diacylglucosamine diphosphatase [Legionella maioricensis]MCL9688074.1 UDP-2,3-diacylglucosamine diphosphatase [Legionella maioricensis]